MYISNTYFIVINCIINKYYNFSPTQLLRVGLPTYAIIVKVCTEIQLIDLQNKNNYYLSIYLFIYLYYNIILLNNIFVIIKSISRL